MLTRDEIELLVTKVLPLFLEDMGDVLEDHERGRDCPIRPWTERDELQLQGYARQVGIAEELRDRLAKKLARG